MANRRNGAGAAGLRGAVFDLDGTLLDSMRVWEEVDAAFLRECGVAVPKDLSERLKILNFEECVMYFINTLGVKRTKEEILTRIGAMTRAAYRTDAVTAKPFVRDALGGLRERGVTMCVATANDYDVTMETLERLGLSEYFAFAVTCGQLGCSKTQPDIYRHCAARLGTTPEETMVAEDALHCVRAARDAGFYVVGVYDDSTPAGDSAEIKALSDQYITSWKEGITL
ncbi:MAG: HAD family phosphatase [Clostridiales bacterium]|jgi:HAD superfamily hydrolase (TIGR01509 family)|nr:HAD family phosphatase [Clostridiales bacterium]